VGSCNTKVSKADAFYPSFYAATIADTTIAFTTIADAFNILLGRIFEPENRFPLFLKMLRGLLQRHSQSGRTIAMEFGYFTLSDNHYDDNPRTPNQFVAYITAEAVHADALGMNSAWIGEHHFNSLGVLSCPDLVLAHVAARTKHIRLAPAVTVLPLHHPIRVAEQWATLDLLSNGRVDFAAGRGYDAREYVPFKVSFADNQSIFDEGLEVVRKLWAAEDRISHHGQHYQFDDVRITPKPVQNPLPTYVASFSKPSIELAARLGCGLIVAPFAAAMSFGGLKQVADLYHESCVKFGTKPGRLMCSYFTHFADNKEQEAAQRARQIRYYKECVIPAFPGDPKTAPPSYRYFIGMVERLQNIKAEDLTENSVLLGSAQQITDTLKKVEAAGFEEVILYFNVGLKPHQQVKEEMDRFMREVAPKFEGKHKQRAA
jgi:alkanesulfonate monooxygenase SsuD/methylene tetrahydromethanopterin reductase-like flavin-dependent oxidoreductase (luciferase family)